MSKFLYILNYINWWKVLGLLLILLPWILCLIIVRYAFF